MSFANEARGRLTEARNVLIDRRRQTNDATERAAIDDAIRELNENLGFINQAALLDAATIVVDATKALETVVRSARLGPFDFDMKALEGDHRENRGPAPQRRGGRTPRPCTGTCCLDRRLLGPTARALCPLEVFRRQRPVVPRSRRWCFPAQHR